VLVAPGVIVDEAELPVAGSVTVTVQVTPLSRFNVNLPSLRVIVLTDVFPAAVATTKPHGRDGDPVFKAVP
jgi:hypothetical protein